MRYLEAAHPDSERLHHVLRTWTTGMARGMPTAGDRPSPGPGQGPSWFIATLTTHDYLDILAKEAGMEAEPVRRDIEPAMEKEVSLEGTGTHWEVRGERMAMRKDNPEKPQVWILLPFHLSSDSPVPIPSLSRKHAKGPSENPECATPPH